MAKRKKGSVTRYITKKVKRYGRKSSGNSMTMIEAGIGGAAYGAVRPFAANMVPDVAALGGYSDNVILGGIGALAAWKGSGLIKKAGMIVLANESFIASSKMTQGLTSGQNTSSGIFIN